ncbi:hypothetical protein [Vreelandella stevensii]|uniref:hypothetical protein n=1 Tax=Vreelandella stevensii TaxID=502821 RepID=UPI00403B2FC1
MQSIHQYFANLSQQLGLADELIRLSPKRRRSAARPLWAYSTGVDTGTSSENALRAYRDSVTPEQREEGETMMDAWLDREPPLSYFSERFGS